MYELKLKAISGWHSSLHTSKKLAKLHLEEMRKLSNITSVAIRKYTELDAERDYEYSEFLRRTKNMRP